MVQETGLEGDGTPAAAGFDPARLARIGDALTREVDAGHLPGAVVAIARRGRLAYLEAFGAQDPASGAAMTPDAVFSIASMTKPMTSVAIMQLFEQGRVLLGDAANVYLPALTALKKGVLDADGRMSRVDAARAPTVQDLLRHTSGLTYQNRGEGPLYAAYPGSSTSASLQLTREQTIEALAHCPLLFEPGEAWEYGFSTDVLGFIVEAVSGMSLGAYLQAHVWSPLGLDDTAFALNDQTRARYATALERDPITGEPQMLFHQREGTPHWESGGGGAISTASDYLRFAEALRRGGALGDARLLGRETVRLMTADHLGPAIDNRIADTMDTAAEGYGFGLGFAVRRADGVAAMAGTAGDYYWSGVFGTYFWIDPARELSCVFMAAAPGAIRLRFRQLTRALVYQAIV